MKLNIKLRWQKDCGIAYKVHEYKYGWFESYELQPFMPIQTQEHKDFINHSISLYSAHLCEA